MVERRTIGLDGKRHLTLVQKKLHQNVIISRLDTVSRSVSVSAYSQKPLSVDMKEAVSRNVNNAVEEYRLASYDIKGLRKIMEDVRADIPVSTYTMDDSGEDILLSNTLRNEVKSRLEIRFLFFGR